MYHNNSALKKTIYKYTQGQHTHISTCARLFGNRWSIISLELMGPLIGTWRYKSSLLHTHFRISWDFPPPAILLLKTCVRFEYCETTFLYFSRNKSGSNTFTSITYVFYASSKKKRGNASARVCMWKRERERERERIFLLCIPTYPWLCFHPKHLSSCCPIRRREHDTI